MKKIAGLLLLALFASSSFLFSQTLVNNGSDIYISSGSSITIVGNYLNLNDGDLKNSGNVFLTGNWTNNALSGNLLQGSTGKVTFYGLNPQMIGGSTSTWFNYLKLMRETGLESDISVSNLLELDNARFKLNMNNLFVEDGASVIGANEQNYIVADAAGQLKQNVGNNDVFFPVGTNTSFAPLILSNQGAEDQFGVNVFDDVLDGGLTGNTLPEIEDCVNLTWNITKTASGGSDLNVTTSWNNSDEGPNFDRLHSGLGYFADGSWVPQAETQASGDGPFSITRSGITTTGAFAVGDLESPMVYTVGLINQQIVITDGWSGISTYLDPSDAAVGSIFQQIIDELIILQSETGVYWPGENLNTLGAWDSNEGFKIKVTNEVQLTVVGTMVENAAVDLSPGWNLIPVLSASNVNVTEVFNGLDIIMAKDVAGFGIYWPDYNINTLQALEPGKSYFVYAGSTGQISFSGSNTKSIAENPVRHEIHSPWDAIAASPNSHVIAFQQDVLTSLQPGDILGLFDKNDLCCGLAQFSGKEFAITAFGNDLMTQDVQGFLPGAEMIYKLFRPSNNETFVIEVQYQQVFDYSGNFQVNGLSVVNKFKMLPADIFVETVGEINLFPNPTNGVFQVEGIEMESSILIYNSIGEVFYNYRDFGPQTIDMSGNPKGIYILKISNTDGSVYRKFILQ